MALRHDPVLARLVLEAARRLYNKPWSGKFYHHWLEDYVKPLAGLVGGIDVPRSRLASSAPLSICETMGPCDRIVTAKAPAWLLEVLDAAARRLGVTRSELVRLGLLLAAAAAEVLTGAQADADD